MLTRKTSKHRLPMVVTLSGLLVMAVYLFDFSGRAQSATIPPGTYTALVNELPSGLLFPFQPGEFWFVLREGGTFVSGYNVRPLATGTYAVSGDNLEFTTPLDTTSCTGKNVFKWNLQGNRLTLTVPTGQTNNCEGMPFMPLTYFRTDQMESIWKNIGPAGGSIRSLLVYNGRIFAGTYDGGIFVSADNGQSWQVKGTFRGNSIQALAAFNGRLYAGLNNNIILDSQDGGETWTFYAFNPVPPPSFTVKDFAVFNGRLYAGVTDQGILRLTDNPALWEKSGTTGLTSLNVTSLAVIGGNLFAGTDGGGVFVSTDGNNWSPVNNGLTFLRISTLAASGTTLYAGTANGSPATTPNEVYVSQDNGQNWSRVGNGLAASFPAGYFNGIHRLLPNGGKLYAASDNGIILNEGANWSLLYRGTFAWGFFSLAGSGNQLFAGAFMDGMSRSSDGGATWETINNGMNARTTYAVFKDNGVLYAGVDDGALVSANDGQTWTRTNLPGVTAYNFLAYDGRVFAGTSFGVYVTTSPGQSWTRSSNGLASGRVTRIVQSGSALYAAVYKGGVYRSTDSGQNWTAASTGLTSLNLNDLVVLGSNLFVSTDDKGVLRSSDQGQNWSAVTGAGLPGGPIFAMTTTGNTLLAAVWDQAIYRSADNGETWTRSVGGFTNPYVFTLCANGGVIYASGGKGIGVMRSTDSGQSWSLFNAGFDSRHSYGFCVSGATLYAATLNGVYASNALVNQETSVSAASYSLDALVEKSIVAAFGIQLATGTEGASSQPLPTTLAGTTVKIRDSNGVERLAPLFYVSPGQVNYEIPAGIATGPATVTISNGNGFAAIGKTDIKATAPSIFTYDASGSGAAAALDAFTFAPGPFNATQPGGQPNIIAVFGTGLGGDATETPDDVHGSVTTRINGAIVITQYAGTAPGYVGLNQYNIELPVGITAGTYSFTVSRGGVTSNPVTITIR